MFRMLIAAALLTLLGCASAPRPALVAAVSEPSDELVCMAECLQGSDDTCQSCADRCLEPGGAPTFVTLGR